MMSILVRIIIPVYNLEDYIENCLNSVVNQTYRELEILCIDDGSTDNSAEKIKAFAEKDPRVKYLYQENAGVSAARNKGLDEATGEYVMFVDGDDYIHWYMVERFIEEAKANTADIICSNTKRTYSLDENVNAAHHSKTGKSITIEDAYLFNNCGYGIIGNLFSRDILVSEKFITELSFCEDVCFMAKALMKAKSIFKVDQLYYYYYQRYNSAVHGDYCLSRSTEIDGWCILYDMAESTNYINLKKLFLEKLLKKVLENRAYCIDRNCEKEVKKKCKIVEKKYLPILLKSNKCSLINKITFWLFFKIPITYKLFRIILDPEMLKVYRRGKKYDN